MKKYLSGFKFFEARVHRMALLSTFSIGLILFLLGVVSLGLLVANRFLSVNVGEITLKISIQDNLAPAIQQKIQSDLSSWQCSKGVKFVSKDAALAEYIAETGDKEIIALMGGINPLLASFHVQIASPCILSDSIEHLKHRIQSNIGVASVDYPLEMIQSLESNTARISWITGLLTIVALVVGIILIMNTQKSAIYASRHAIRTMQLIGATPTFVRGPFLKMGILQGFIGGIIAIALLVGLLPLIFFQIDGLHFGKEILEEKYFFVILGGILLFGTCLGFLGSYWAVNRFLHKSLDELSI